LGASEGQACLYQRAHAGARAATAAQDHLCSPLVELPKAAAGALHEAALEAALRAEGIPFVSEADLRQDGFARTPVRPRHARFAAARTFASCDAARSQDVRLDVPIAVRGRVVFWIDSKASFGDPHVHAEKGMPQFQAYVNRYGPGLVLYWFGYVAELDTHPQVALSATFPPSKDIERLPGAPVGRCNDS
jgi:hypothetical protein